MFSVNMILKAVISSSAAVMWSLIHVLQLFRYILFINVNTSDIMETLISYLAIVVGDTGDTENILPDIIAQYLVNVSDTSTNFTLYRKFSDNGKNFIVKCRLWLPFSSREILKENISNFHIFGSWSSCFIRFNENMTKYTLCRS